MVEKDKKPPIQHKPEIWPFRVDVERGFSLEELKKICGTQHGPREGATGFSSPWLFWSSEIYSHGKTIRNWVNWPNWLPIPAFSDHGIHHFPLLHGPELANRARVHLVWSKWREKAGEGFSTKRVIRVTHPWVTYRRAKGLRRRRSAKGTLIFLPHSLPGHQAPKYSIERFIETVMSSDLMGPPYVLCVAMHDVHRGVLPSISNLGLPIVSAGNTSSPFFVDRFYDLVSRFRYSVSPNLGSQLYFCEEIGVRSYIIPSKVRYATTVLDEIPEASVTRGHRIEELFSLYSSVSEEARSQEINDGLSLDVNSGDQKKQIRLIFLRELVRLFPWIVFQGLKFSRRFFTSGKKRVAGSL